MRLFRKIALEIGRTKKVEKEDFVLYVKIGEAKQIETAFHEAKEKLRFSLMISKKIITSELIDIFNFQSHITI